MKLYFCVSVVCNFISRVSEMNPNMRLIACTGRYCTDELKIKCIRYKLHKELPPNKNIEYTINPVVKDNECAQYVPVRESYEDKIQTHTGLFR